MEFRPDDPAISCAQLAGRVWPSREEELRRILFEAHAQSLEIDHRKGTEADGGDSVVNKEQGVAFLALVPDLQTGVEPENRRLQALYIATDHVHGMPALAFDRELYDLARDERMPVDQYRERVIARLDAIRPWAPVAREEAERSSSAPAADEDAPAAEEDAPAADPPPPARGEHEDPRIMAGLIAFPSRCRQGRRDLRPADAADPASRHQLDFAEGLFGSGQVMLVADPLAFDEKKGLARWRCPGTGCAHPPDSPGRLWRHILANTDHIPGRVTLALFSACLLDSTTGDRVVYVSDMVGLIGGGADMDFIGRHTVHARIAEAMRATHPAIPKRAMTASDDPAAAPPAPAPAPSHPQPQPQPQPRPRPRRVRARRSGSAHAGKAPAPPRSDTGSPPAPDTTPPSPRAAADAWLREKVDRHSAKIAEHEMHIARMYKAITAMEFAVGAMADAFPREWIAKVDAQSWQ
ncbi:hypothetical protein WJX74_008238 [Apatococcus lobatus]|uniref:Uncharacterized protein n=1 Tax=Apatococcus lobatus TaxID=904363 RepID=A0AAW1Q2F5_9CHLO